MCQEFKRLRRRQVRYEARLRAGVALYPAPLGAVEIDALATLSWLPERPSRTPRSIDRTRGNRATGAQPARVPPPGTSIGPRPGRDQSEGATIDIA
jgi:hypothetical protein